MAVPILSPLAAQNGRPLSRSPRNSFYTMESTIFTRASELCYQDTRKAIDEGNTALFDKITAKQMETDTNLRWFMMQGEYIFGVSSYADFVQATKSYTMKGSAGQIQCPCLVMEAERDIFFSGQPQEIFDGIKAQKEVGELTSEDGAENHCGQEPLHTKMTSFSIGWIRHYTCTSNRNDEFGTPHTVPSGKDVEYSDCLCCRICLRDA